MLNGWKNKLINCRLAYGQLATRSKKESRCNIPYASLGTMMAQRKECRNVLPWTRFPKQSWEHWWSLETSVVTCQSSWCNLGKVGSVEGSSSPKVHWNRFPRHAQKQCNPAQNNEMAVKCCRGLGLPCFVLHLVSVVRSVQKGKCTPLCHW